VNAADEVGQRLVIAAVGAVVAIDRADPDLMEQAADTLAEHARLLRGVAQRLRSGGRGVGGLR
jgi:hypothetical protein